MRRLIRVIALLLLLLAFPSPTRAETGETLAFTLTRALSGEYAASGDWIALSYTVRNNSEYPITTLTVSDTLLGEIASIERLEAGESRTVIRRVQITKDCRSEPSARFSLGGHLRTVSIAPADIRVEKTDLKAKLRFETREEQTVTLEVTNGGNAPVYGVKAAENTLGDMGESADRLDPGASVTFLRACRPGGRYQCVVTAVSAAGKSVSARSNEILGENGIGPVSEAPASLSAERDEDGQVFITLFNPGPETWRNVTVRELSSGREDTFSFVPAGETRALWTPPADATGPFAFEAGLTDGTALSASLEVAAPATTQPPEETEKAGRGVPALNGASFRMEENPQTYRQMLCATGALLAVILLVWWISGVRRRRLARKRRMKQRQENRKKQPGRKNGEKAS